MAINGVVLLAQILVLLTVPPFFLGVIAKTKAFFAGRRGPPLLQPYYDLIKLFRKGTVYSVASSFVLRLGPLICFAGFMGAGLFFPLLGQAPLHFEGDVIVFAYLLALGRFWILLSAFDVGSSFAGMGASREAVFGAFSELAFFLGLVVLAMTSHTTSLSNIFQWKLLHLAWQPVFLLLFVTLFLNLLAENSRMPIDDPATHLELTMIHEAMILDYGGIDLGWVLYGAAIKLFIFIAFAVSLLWPQPSAWDWYSPLLFFMKLVGMAVMVGVVEATTARIRLIKVPQFLIANFVVTLFALLVALFGRGD